MNNFKLIEKLYSEVIEGINPTWYLTDDSKWYDHIISLPSNLQITYLIVILHNQVFNGGVHQYFVNGYGQFAKETIKALNTIGATKKSLLLEKALALVNASNDPDELFRKLLKSKQIKSLFKTDELFKLLNKLDIDFYNIEDEEMEELLANYLNIK